MSRSREAEELQHHPQRGTIFQSWVVSEVDQSFVHHGDIARLFHYRETRGPELDLLIYQGRQLDIVEIKSAAAVTSVFFKNLHRFSERQEDAGNKFDSFKQYHRGDEATLA